MSEQDHWKHRVKIEYEEVGGRVARLKKFLESNQYVAEAERLRLIAQLETMRQYRQILWERIHANFQ